jgi:hypothetical protein
VYDKTVYIIQPHFISGKVLVSTGYPDSFSVKSEVIDLKDASNICQDYEDYPIQVMGAVGGLVNEVDPLVCGGEPYTNRCHIINHPGQSSEMLEKRGYAASLTLNTTHLWITGGLNSSGIALQTSEFVSIGQNAVKGPNLPYAVHLHCLVRVNSSTALLCGGNNGEFLNACYYMNLEDHSWSQGPSMITKRIQHSCGMFKSATHQGRSVVIAAGGYGNGDFLDSVEILNPTTNTWIEGNIHRFRF